MEATTTTLKNPMVVSFEALGWPSHRGKNWRRLVPEEAEERMP